MSVCGLPKMHCELLAKQRSKWVKCVACSIFKGTSYIVNRPARIMNYTVLENGFFSALSFEFEAGNRSGL